MSKINVQNTEITIVFYQQKDYISLTDMANARIGESRAADVIKNWLRNRYTLEFLGTWEAIHNPRFKVVEFDHFKSQAGLPGFVLSVSEWIEKTDALFINEGLSQTERLVRLNKIAIQQMQILDNVDNRKLLK